MTCTEPFHCKLCDERHVSVTRILTENEKGNIKLKCGRNEKVFYKSEKCRLLDRAKHLDQIDKRIDNYLKVDTSGITIIKEDTQFIGCEDGQNEIIWKPEYDSKYIILNSDMGKGKSSFIGKYIDTMNQKKNCSILCISQRKTFTNYICNDYSRFDITNYQDITNKDYNHHRLCIQIESLHKVTRKC